MKREEFDIPLTVEKANHTIVVSSVNMPEIPTFNFFYRVESFE
jgi:hypothetical protein